MFRKVCHVDFSLCLKLEMIVWFVKYWRSLQTARFIAFLFGNKDSHIRDYWSDFQFSKMPLSRGTTFSPLARKASLWLWPAFLLNKAAMPSTLPELPLTWALVLLIRFPFSSLMPVQTPEALPTPVLDVQGIFPNCLSLWNRFSMQPTKNTTWWFFSCLLQNPST